MSTEVMIALIASVTSVVVAVVSLITAVISNRHAKETAKELEGLKVTLQRRAARDELARVQHSKELDALSKAIRSVQQIKDTLQVILTSSGTSMAAKHALQYIAESRRLVTEAYEEILSDLDQESAAAAHKAKNWAVEVESILQQELGGNPYVSSLSPLKRRALQAIRRELSDLQHVLRDLRLERLNTGVSYE